MMKNKVNVQEVAVAILNDVMLGCELEDAISNHIFGINPECDRDTAEEIIEYVFAYME